MKRFGYTTGSVAQLQPLERLGIQATFRTDRCIQQLIAQLRLGIPIPAQGPLEVCPSCPGGLSAAVVC